MQVDPGLTALWFRRLKLNCEEQLSNFALNFNLRLYIMGELCEMAGPFGSVLGTIREELAKVRRCRLTLSKSGAYTRGGQRK